MINNRQGGRRRGRGGQRPGGNTGRQDNRQRGNAPQLHEKYKNMARDAQLAGDRVQSEYYLQFAEHYFRVMNEMQARREEQRDQRKPSRERFDDDDQAGEEMEQPKRRRAKSEDEGDEAPKRSRANGRTSKKADASGGDSIAMDALPPSIGADESEDEKPKRRARKPKTDDGDTEGATAS